MLQCSQPHACTWPLEKMDFRSNEAGRIVPASHSTCAAPIQPRWATVVAAGASSPNMKIETLSVDFSDDQKRYLEGFTSGLQISRVGRSLGGATPKVSAEPTGPDAAHIKAQDRVIV